jgi:four helix bundle protein
MQAAAQSCRRQRRDKARFFTIAKGSADELKDQLIFVREMGYWPGNQTVQAKIEAVCRMLSRLIQKTLDCF